MTEGAGRRGKTTQKGHVKYLGLYSKNHEKPFSCLTGDWHGKLHFVLKRSFWQGHNAQCSTAQILKYLR